MSEKRAFPFDLSEVVVEAGGCCQPWGQWNSILIIENKPSVLNIWNSAIINPMVTMSLKVRIQNKLSSLVLTKGDGLFWSKGDG